MNSIKVYNTKMYTIFMNSENSTTSNRVLINLADKIDLKKYINILVYQILACTIH